jgi:dCMP deaminase
MARESAPNATATEVGVPDATPHLVRSVDLLSTISATTAPDHGEVPSGPPLASAGGSEGGGGAAGGGAADGAGSGQDSGAPRVVRARKDYLPWDDYFMAVAFLSAMRSKDPSTQVGACIVDASNRIVGIGYNGFPRGCSDDVLPWAREAASPLDTKYLYVCHAEANAILNRNHMDVRACRMYVALFPCNECAKLIIQSGITEVVFLSDKYHDSPSMTASRRMFDLAGVRYRCHLPRDPTLTIHFGAADAPTTHTTK